MADGKLVPLPADTESREFARTYDACLRTRKALDKPAAPPKFARPKAAHVVAMQGTVRAAAAIYKGTTHYLEELRDTTRAAYDSVLTQMIDNIGDTLMADYVDVDLIDEYTELVSARRVVEKEINGKVRKVKMGGKAVARMHLLVLTELWKACRRQPEFNIKKVPNPFRDATRPYKKAKNPAQPWSEDAQRLFIDTAPDNLVLGVLLLRYFGQRGSDAVKVLWKEFVSRTEIVAGKKVVRWGILVAPQKGDDPEPEFLELPAILADALLAARETRGAAETILVNRWGQPWTGARGLGQAIRLHLIKVGLAAKGVKTIHMHGLRKNAAIMAADTDFGIDGIKTITLHRSDEMAKYYAEKRNRERLRSKVVARINEMVAEEQTPRPRKRAGLRVVR
nr:hypothetical protein CIT39_15605 [Bradyrhizobium symbiodeficiens]